MRRIQFYFFVLFLAAIVAAPITPLLSYATPGGSYWLEFHEGSSTFRTYWKRAEETPRTGRETQWNSVADNARLLAESYWHLVERDGWWQERCPHVACTTWALIEAMVDEIEASPEAERLFHLAIFVRDLGWVDTGCGQFHQQASGPIMETIMRELGYSEEWTELGRRWVEEHSIPAEIYLGEVSPATIERVGEYYASCDLLPMRSMFALLSLLELNCIRPDVSAVLDANARMICHLSHPRTLANEMRQERLVRLANYRLLHSQSSEEEQINVAEETEWRAFLLWCSLISSPLETQRQVARFLEEVDLHYVAGTFPHMEPEAIAQFLIRSAAACYGVEGEPCKEVINKNQFLANELNTALLEESEVLSEWIELDVERGWIVWNPGVERESYGTSSNE